MRWKKKIRMKKSSTAEKRATLKKGGGKHGTLICEMNPLDVGTVTLPPAIEHMVVPGFLIPTSWPVLGSTMQTRSVAEAAPRMTALSSVVVFPLPKAAATVLFMYRSLPRTVDTASLRSVPKGLGEVAVALAMAKARALAARAETSWLAGSQPRTCGMRVLLLTVRVRGCVFFVLFFCESVFVFVRVSSTVWREDEEGKERKKKHQSREVEVDARVDVGIGSRSNDDSRNNFFLCVVASHHASRTSSPQRRRRKKEKRLCLRAGVSAASSISWGRKTTRAKQRKKLRGAG